MVLPKLHLCNYHSGPLRTASTSRHRLRRYSIIYCSICKSVGRVDRGALPQEPGDTLSSASARYEELDHYDEIDSLYDFISDEVGNGCEGLDQATGNTAQQPQTPSVCGGPAAVEIAYQLNLTDHMEMNELADDNNDVSQPSFIIITFIINSFSRLLRLLLLVTN